MMQIFQTKNLFPTKRKRIITVPGDSRICGIEKTLNKVKRILSYAVRFIKRLRICKLVSPEVNLRNLRENKHALPHPTE